MATALRPGRSHCSVVDSDCEAPAGFRGGGGYASLPGVRRADLLTCYSCGEPVCRPCSTEVDGKPECLSHSEQREAERARREARLLGPSAEEIRDMEVARAVVGPRSTCPHCNPGAVR